MMFYWGEPEIAKLRELWTAGLSCAQIARELKTSKNSVVGKAHRLGLSQRRPGRIVHVLAPRPVAVSKEVGFSIIELEREQCRWPIAEARSGHRFCGDQCQPDSPYCEAHRAQAYSGFKFQRQRPPHEHNIIRSEAA
jgi:GcrA cell cycle regulator